MVALFESCLRYRKSASATSEPSQAEVLLFLGVVGLPLEVLVERSDVSMD